MSSFTFGAIVFLFAAFWLFLAARGIGRDIKKNTRVKWMMGAMGALVIVGAAGFFAMALSATGVLKVPNSFQWPAGYVRGIVEMADGTYIVPLIPMGRVQIYDPHWNFLRGWNVDASGGDFTIRCGPGGTISVFAARTRRQYSFTQEGKLISIADPQKVDDSSCQTLEGYVSVPTNPFLWVFSNPFLSWGVAVIGTVGVAATRKFAQLQK